MYDTIPKELKYSQDHSWVRVEEDGTMTIGITHQAQEMMGDLSDVGLPAVGELVYVDKPCCVVESIKTVLDISSPIAGEVIENNAPLFDEPHLINQSPYGDGWLYKIKPAKDSGFDDLLTAEEYAKFIGEKE